MIENLKEHLDKRRKNRGNSDEPFKVFWQNKSYLTIIKIRCILFSLHILETYPKLYMQRTTPPLLNNMNIGS